MPIYKIDKIFDRHNHITENAIAVMRMFGLTKDSLYKTRFECKCDIEIDSGDIVYITGPSGSGKTVILKELEKGICQQKQINLSGITLPNNKAVIDCIEVNLPTALKCFSTAGLADCPALLNTPANLSEGQQWRFKLALALASNKPFIFADEFGSLLDRITAACVSHSIRKFADRHKVTFILASAHQDILLDLSPDVIVTRNISNGTNVTYKRTNRRKV